MARPLVAAGALLFGFACGAAPDGAPVDRASSSDAGAEGGSRGAEASTDPEGGADAASPQWSQSIDPSAADQDPMRLYVLSESTWAIQAGTPGLSNCSWTKDAGKTWSVTRTGFLQPTARESTFWFLGQTADGRVLATWKHPSCSTPCVSSSAPGKPGDAFLLQWNESTDVWSVVDTVPAGDLRFMVSGGGHIWIYGDVFYRFDGAGKWVPLVAPTDLSMTQLTADANGTLRAVAASSGTHNQVYEQSPDGTWSIIYTPPQGSDDTISLVSSASAQYVIHEDQLFRRDGSQWTDISPKVTVSGDQASPEWHMALSDTGTLAAVTSITDFEQWYPMRGFTSADKGATWEARSDGLPAYILEDVVFNRSGALFLLMRSEDTVYVWRRPSP